MEKHELIERTSNSLGWNQDKTTHAIDIFTMRSRESFLNPPYPFSRDDIYPWRFNRALSCLRRPLFEIPATDRVEYWWGNRLLYHSHRYISELIVTSRIFAKSSEMRSLIGKFNRERGTVFNNEVAELFQAKPGLIVKNNLKKIGAHRIANDNGDLGDIDVLVVDPANKYVLVIECKDLALARTPYELRIELDTIFKGTPKQKSTIEKHNLRLNWIRTHTVYLSQFLGISITESWKVEPLLLFDDASIGYHLYKSPMVTISYRSLKESVLPNWDRYRRWKFS